MRSDDGARPQVGQRTCLEVAVLQVEVDVSLTPYHDAHAVVVDDEGRALFHNESEQRWVAVYDAQFVVEEHLLLDFRHVWLQDVLHLQSVHQSRFMLGRAPFVVEWFVHVYALYLCAKIMFLIELMFCFCINRTKRTFFYSER